MEKSVQADLTDRVDALCRHYGMTPRDDAQPAVSARQSGDALDIDLVFKEVEGRIGRNIAQGRGLAPVIAQSFNLRRDV